MTATRTSTTTTDIDIDIGLTPGEVLARSNQNMTPDKSGYDHCNPEDFELCPMEVKEQRHRITLGIAADAGAGDPVMPR